MESTYIFCLQVFYSWSDSYFWFVKLEDIGFLSFFVRFLNEIFIIPAADESRDFVGESNFTQYALPILLKGKK